MKLRKKTSRSLTQTADKDLKELRTYSPQMLASPYPEMPSTVFWDWDLRPQGFTVNSETQGTGHLSIAPCNHLNSFPP